MLDVYDKATQYSRGDSDEAEINRLRPPVNRDNDKNELTLSTSHSLLPTLLSLAPLPLLYCPTQIPNILNNMKYESRSNTFLL